MTFRKKEAGGRKISWKFTKPRIAVWCIVLLACVLFSALVMDAPEKTERTYWQVDCQERDYDPYALKPGSTLVQQFYAAGQSTGEVSDLFLNILRQEGSEGSLTVRLYREKTGEALLDITKEHSELPGCADVEAAAQEALKLSETRASQRPGQDEINGALRETVMLGDDWFLLKSGEQYRLEITNQSETDTLYLLGNSDIQSGKLLLDGEQQSGFLNISWMRKSLYTPSRLLLLMVLLTDATVLLGLALVLFTDVKTHVLYLVLAVGFGVVTLFDLTPIYGFDMRFQFDSAYVLSNQLMGLEGPVWMADEENPATGTIYYYRRYCDDYSQYQFYKADEVSANYTDMKAGIRNPFVSEEERELVLVETEQGFLAEQLYLYLPQAVGFVIARLLGLGMYPMLQLARLISYAVFTAVMYTAIRKLPFGRQVFLTAALIPTVMVQMVSITRDAMIICMSFYITAKTVQMAFAPQKPGKWDWVLLAAVSALLAPCKMIYLPVSCLFLMVVYRHYIMPAGDRGKKLLLRILKFGAAAVLVFAVLNLNTIRGILFGSSVSVYNSESYSIAYMLANPGEILSVFGNTLRTEFGSYFVNAVQLFDIDLGCSDGITIAVFVLLALGCCSAEVENTALRKGERGYMLLVAAGVFLLTAVASLRWTPMGSDVIVGLQGRYLTPVLPLICLACGNSRFVRVSGDAALIVEACCCLFPAVSLMNMFLWAVGC